VTAEGKKTTTGLSAGDRVLITNDPTKASTRTDGDWHPSRVKTGVTAATVLRKEPVAGRRTRYNVVTDAGTVPDLTGAQTFLLAPPTPPTQPTAPPADPASGAEADALVVLPHTGLRVPHTRLTAGLARHRVVGERVGYDAVLYFDGEPVGLITNPHGNMTLFNPTQTGPINNADLIRFAARCHDERGGPVTDEAVLDLLIQEREAADTVEWWLARSRTPVRVLMPIKPLGNGHGHVKGLPVGVKAPADPEWWGAIVRALHHKRPLAEGEIFQVWTGNAWEDLPPIAEVTKIEPDGAHDD
jgi:hypothetical protein